MADTSELREKILRVVRESFYDDLITRTPDEFADAILALPGLQAEAPEDAEVAEIEKRHRKYAEQNTCAGVVGFAPGAGAPFYEDVATLLAKLRALQSRTSQAEAQAPAVLTEDDAKDIRFAKILSETADHSVLRDTIIRLVSIIDRLSPPSGNV